MNRAVEKNGETLLEVGCGEFIEALPMMISMDVAGLVRSRSHVHQAYSAKNAKLVMPTI